jgi:hypothetical protein
MPIRLPQRARNCSDHLQVTNQPGAHAFYLGEQRFDLRANLTVHAGVARKPIDSWLSRICELRFRKQESQTTFEIASWLRVTH